MMFSRMPIPLMMLVLCAPWSLAHGQIRDPTPCKYEENCDCAAPGITIRWKAAYCMALSETDDYENQGVQHCLVKDDPAAVRKMRACQQNAHWKAMICGVLRDKKDVQPCIRDKTFIPTMVARGAGGL